MTKDYRDIYKKFLEAKPNLGKKTKIMDLKEKNPDRMYIQVRVDEDYDPDGYRLQEKFKLGYEPVIDDCAVESDYDSNKKAGSYRPTTIEHKGRGKAHFLWMSISKEQFIKNEQERTDNDKAKMIASSKGRKVHQKGRHLKITDSEVNETNMNDPINDND